MSKMSAAQRLALLEKQAPHDRKEMLQHMLQYGETDLLCYRAQNSALAKRQAAAFEPILAWANAEYKMAFHTTTDLVPVAQPKESLTKLRHVFQAATDRELAALALLTSLMGSILLTLALWKGRLDADQVLAAAYVDEDFQAEQWGKDEDVEAERKRKQEDIHAAVEFLQLN